MTSDFFILPEVQIRLCSLLIANIIMRKFLVYSFCIAQILINTSLSQSTKHPLYFNTHLGVSLDGKGDLGGSSFMFGFQKALSKKHNLAINYEFFALKNDNSGFFEFRKSKSAQLLYIFRAGSNTPTHFEIGLGGQVKWHHWRLSSNGPYMVIGIRDGAILRVNPNTSVNYNETSIGYTVAPAIYRKLSNNFSLGFIAQYQNDNEGYSVISLRLGGKFLL